MAVYVAHSTINIKGLIPVAIYVAHSMINTQCVIPIAVYVVHSTINTQGVTPTAVYVAHSTIYLSCCSFSKFTQVLFHINYDLKDAFSLSNHIP